jgi:hypothetical protein
VELDNYALAVGQKSIKLKQVNNIWYNSITKEKGKGKGK